MGVKTFTLDGKLVSAAEDQTILDVAREHRIDIPTLCHLEGLSEVGACRLCLVEIAGASRLQPACMTPVSEGMEVATHTPRLDGYRRMLVELLFSERNHYCSVCVANGQCELQAVGAGVGMDHVRFEYLNPPLRMDASHERFVVDHHRCILCTRCVRVCDEIEGAHTWDVMGRGVRSRVITDLNQPWGTSESCTSCGKCAHVCPTGAIVEKGNPVTEATKNIDFLTYLKTAREKKLWVRRSE